MDRQRKHLIELPDSHSSMSPSERQQKISAARQLFTNLGQEKGYGQLRSNEVTVDKNGSYGVYENGIRIFKPSSLGTRDVQFPKEVPLGALKSTSSDGTEHYEYGEIRVDQGHRVFLSRTFMIKDNPKNFFERLGQEKGYGKLFYDKVYENNQRILVRYENGIEMYLHRGLGGPEEQLPKWGSSGPLVSEKMYEDGTTVKTFKNGVERKDPDGLRIYTPNELTSTESGGDSTKRWYECVPETTLKSIRDTLQNPTIKANLQEQAIQEGEDPTKLNENLETITDLAVLVLQEKEKNYLAA